MTLYKMRIPLNVLAGVLFVLGMFAAQSVRADQLNGSYTLASLNGSYAYVNNNANVASFGPITFYGNGYLAATIKVNLPDPTTTGGRTIDDLSATGTYTVKSDGTGAAVITFSNGLVITYNFVITQTTKKRNYLLATGVFAVGQSGGLNGQLVAPTWTRRSDSVAHDETVPGKP